MLVALNEIIKSGEAAEENVRFGVGVRVQLNGDDEDDNMKLENETFVKLKVCCHDYFEMMCYIRFSFCL